MGAHNETHNGAGLRINQANDVTIRSCWIHNNDMGIMSDGDGTQRSATNQLMENCLVYRNGDLLEPGQNHNLYLGGTSVTLRGCEVHTSLTGHNVKSRAHCTVVVACYIHDSANREFDLVDSKGDTSGPGSDAVLVGNVIVKDNDCTGNRAVIHFGQDGCNEHNGALYLIHNTIVTPFIPPVVHLTAPKARARLFNNILWDGGTHRSGQALVISGKDAVEGAVKGRCNWVASGFKGVALEAGTLQQTIVGFPGAVIPFSDIDKGDYHLARPDPLVIEQGFVLPDDESQPWNGRLLEYKAPQGIELRPINGNPDLGGDRVASSNHDQTRSWRGPSKGRARKVTFGHWPVVSGTGLLKTASFTCQDGYQVLRAVGQSLRKTEGGPLGRRRIEFHAGNEHAIAGACPRHDREESFTGGMVQRVGKGI